VIRAAAVLAVALLPAAAAAQQPRERYTSKDGRFTVKFPGKPKESEKTTATALGEVAVVTASYATAGGNVFLVTSSEFPAEATKPERLGTLFDGVRESLKGKDGQVLSDESVMVGKDRWPGRDVEIEKGKLRMRFRLVVRDDRLYQVAVLGTKSFATGKDATTFIESFEPTK
jgi:hypothetical protein